MFLRKYLILIIFFFIDVSFADQYTAKVIRVIDGDTIWVKSDNKHIKIRLSYIDAPELKQIYGIRSRDFLINLVLEKNVQINTSKNYKGAAPPRSKSALGGEDTTVVRRDASPQ